VLTSTAALAFIAFTSLDIFRLEKPGYGLIDIAIIYSVIFFMCIFVSIYDNEML
jgi:hypothetical protein